MPTPPKRNRGSRDEGRPKSGKSSGGPKRSFRKEGGGDSERRSDSERAPRERKSWGDKPASAGSRPFRKKEGEDKPRSDERKPFKKKEWGDRPSSGGDKPFRKKEWGDKPRSDERRPFKKKEWGDKPTSGADKPFRKKEWGDKPRSDERKPFAKKAWGDKSSSGERPFRKRESEDSSVAPDREEKRPFSKRASGDKPFRKRADKPYSSERKESRPFKKEESGSDRPYQKKEWHERPYVKGAGRTSENKSESGSREKPTKHYRDKQKSFASPSEASADGLIRLNKYIANAGICSRREADKLIETGVITVNGKIITELGFKVAPTDEINFGGQVLKKEKSVYILLNKPKDFITTLDDPEGRKTVLDLIKNATRERVYPVGRLDRNTTGLLLLTNDGELTKKLTHPRYGVKKIYQVTLDKALAKADMQKIADGMELEDGPVKADDISYVGDGKDKTEVGIQLHSGRNRVVRRIFETLGYDVVKLDRVYFAGLTKKDLPRGRWRLLSALEISMLKMVPGE
jgi:23S rRNA pseudouridine2605 synthase